MRDCPSGDRAERGERSVAMDPAPLGFLLQWTLGAIVCCESKLTGKETVSLTPHPLQCLRFVGGQEGLLETSYVVVAAACFCFPVLRGRTRASM